MLKILHKTKLFKTFLSFVGMTMIVLFSDSCNKDVGLESGTIPDSSLSASSSYDPLNVGPQHARLGQDTAGGAWCPKHPIGPELENHQEWFGANLTMPHVISSVLTQGRWVWFMK